MHSTPSKQKRQRLRNALSGISVHTIKFIKPLLFILMVEFLWFALAFCVDISSDAVRALDFYSSVWEHLMMSLLLAIGSAVIFDISLAERNKK